LVFFKDKDDATNWKVFSSLKSDQIFT